MTRSLQVVQVKITDLLLFIKVIFFSCDSSSIPDNVRPSVRFNEFLRLSLGSAILYVHSDMSN